MSAVSFRPPLSGIVAGFALALAASALAACASDSTSLTTVGPSGPTLAAGPSANLDTQVACRERVNEMYDRRNRADSYMPGSTVNTPFSSNYQAGITSRGLANQYAYESTKNECERNSGTGQGVAPAPVSASPAPNRR